MDISRRQAAMFCLALTAFELLAYLASDMVMPATLRVTHDFSAARHHVPGALYAFLLGGIAFQWLLGPLSNRFGARPLLLAGTLVFSAACLATAASQHIAGFNLLRFVQGASLGFIIVVSYPALQETFAERDAVRRMALFANVALLSPLAGPLAGTLPLRVLSWREQFVALGSAGEATGSAAALPGMLSTAMLAGGGAVPTWSGAGDSPARFAIGAGSPPLLGGPLLWRVPRRPRPAPAVTPSCSHH